MQYQHIKLQTPVQGLTVRSPGTHVDTVVVGFTPDYDLEGLRSVMDEVTGRGVKNIVFDLSQTPERSQVPLVGFLDGAFAIATGLNTRYVGVDRFQIDATEPSFQRYIGPKMATGIAAAVETFPRE